MRSENVGVSDALEPEIYRSYGEIKAGFWPFYFDRLSLKQVENYSLLSLRVLVPKTKNII